MVSTIYKCKRQILIASTLIIIQITSCKVVYFPNNHNVPMLTQKGELQVAGITDIFSSFELQTAYAVSNQLGVMLNGNYRNLWMLSTGEDGSNFKPYKYVEGGLGYFGGGDDDVMLEIFGGAGVGIVHGLVKSEPTNELKAVSGTLTKFFIQPAIGTTFERKFIFNSTVEYNFALRLSAVNLLDETRLFAEPCLMSKTGGKTVRLINTIGYSMQLHKSKSDSWVHNPLILGFGVQVAIGRLFDKE